MHKNNDVVLILTRLHVQKQSCVRVHQRTGVQWFKLRMLGVDLWIDSHEVTNKGLIDKTELSLIIVLEHVLSIEYIRY